MNLMSSISFSPWRSWRPAVPALALALLAGCASSAHRAPVEERNAGAGRPGASAASLPAPAASAAGAGALDAGTSKPLLPGAENAGKPGYYTVKPGDTMIRVGLENGQNWRDIARWNGIDKPDLIEVGQVLRVVPPGADSVGARPVAPTARIESRALNASAAPASGPAPTAATPGAPAPAPASVARDSEGEPNWLWPATGSVLTPFDETKSKGLAIGGKAGDPVFAAADGRVVYAGAGLRGYGNLVIVKHNATYLTAYAHNQTLLVKEDQAVSRGQKIAEMGSSDAERVQLHFEIRRQGKPVDPARLLPAR